MLKYSFLILLLQLSMRLSHCACIHCFFCKSSKLATEITTISLIIQPFSSCRKGPIQPVLMTVMQRMGNKKVTLVENLEFYGIMAEKVAHTAQKLAAASTTGKYSLEKKFCCFCSYFLSNDSLVYTIVIIIKSTDFACTCFDVMGWLMFLELPACTEKPMH